MEIKVENLSKNFKNKKALNNVSLDLQSGGLIGLIGPNGAGKSTLFNILTTLQKPTTGKIFLNNKDIVKNPSLMQKNMGFMPQKVPFLPNLTLKEYLNYIAGIKGIPARNAKMEIESLITKFNLLTVPKKQTLSHFSGGMIQRVGMCVALMGNPQIIVVDEPTAGLDPEERINLRNILSELATEKLVIMSTHIISDIEAVANKIIVLKDGKVKYDGSAIDLMSKASKNVWSMTFPTQTSIKEIEKLGKVSSIVQTMDGIQARIIANQKPTANSINVKPHLEDAYLFLESEGDKA
ncbi:ABC transporter ATP-binding protein [Limosilactobacillus reuteri]|uniref:ABC transporter ATP-binding protein n=1 Tax=Limosilactobacillus reuteri TaxID=1598 RepID=A0AB73QEL9_LIMRT|nr:ATP-binding cassette domain-containing protein [Limosilactobacillus reuteri]OYS47217.1 ABC transporter ATP-binding protein [Limosilactobacillus reuteri]OYS51306.1 ABC transporter ATP-binding protein [Limosilactobacillus reuteri]OYS88149.1 ABC transporter ATP-binding protein [Limosilactobacillus reuteri]OYS89456.1 ABC transporter ATP-binding protein [Limosilactobacillus reuteri]OYS92883.1 ABC transporter ATP-binding protein [Limosilactobacillus reuteri]